MARWWPCRPPGIAGALRSGDRMRRPASRRLAGELAAAGCEIEAVSAADKGMGNSIACGARRAAEIEGLPALLVQPADMPWLAAGSVEAIVQVPRDRLTVVPTCAARTAIQCASTVELLPELAHRRRARRETTASAPSA